MNINGQVINVGDEVIVTFTESRSKYQGVIKKFVGDNAYADWTLLSNGKVFNGNSIWITDEDLEIEIVNKPIVYTKFLSGLVK